MHWLKHDSLVMGLWIEVVLLFVMDWLLQVHLFVAEWVRPVVLCRCHNVNKVHFVNIPFPMFTLVSLVLCCRNVVMVRDPMVLRFMLLFWSHSLWVHPPVLIEVMRWMFIVTITMSFEMTVLSS